MSATRHGSFVACRTKDATPEAINYAMHERMTECEMRIAERTREATSDLIVLDGPLRKGQHITDAVGLVKTHHVRYLPDALNKVVGALACRRTHAGVPHRRPAVQPARLVPATARSAGRPVGGHRAVRGATARCRSRRRARWPTP